MFERPRNLASAIQSAAKKMRQKYPDHKLFSSAGPDEDFPGLIKVARSDWPEGVTISIPAGGRYPGQAGAGVDVIAGYEKGRPGMPFLRGLVGGARGANTSGGGTVTFGPWIQSNFGPGQTAAGAQVSPSLYRMDPDSSDSWPLPTSDEEGVYHNGPLPYGLVRFSPTSGADHYGAAWQYLVEESADGHGWKIGAWNVATRAPLWEANFGSASGDGGYINVNPPKTCRFFADAVNGWLHALPDTGGSFPLRIMSAKSATDSRQSNVSRYLHNASLHSWVTTGETPVTKSYFCFPSTPATSGSGQATIDFYAMDQTTGEWEGEASADVAEVPEGGSAEIPDLIENGTEFGDPVPWLPTNEVLVWVSGGLLDLTDSARWLKSHWTVRSLKPDGTAGARLKSETVEAVFDPPILEHANLKTAVMAGDYPLTDVADTYWLGGMELGEDSNTEWAHFRDLAPILLPTEFPNKVRIDNLEAALAIDTNGNRVWPESLKNSGGGKVVDSEGSAWWCVMKPVQMALGGTLSERDTGELQATYLWQYSDNNQCADPPYNHPNHEGVSTTPVHPIDGYPTPPEPGGDTVNLNEECSPGSGTSRNRAWRIDQITSRPKYIRVWNQKPAWTLRTFLCRLESDGTYTQKDISQLKDLVHSLTVAGVPVAATEIDFPILDNVWKIIPFPTKNLVVLLRDLHADDTDGNPSPAVEVWSTIGDWEKVATVRLGSYTELKASTDFATFLWREGDQEWDPYYNGPPRMKACLDLSGNPVILAMVEEKKKVLVASESQFRRICYILIELSTPSSPTVTRIARTSPDEGVGNIGEIGGNYPLAKDWDTLILTPGRVAWIRDSVFRETTS